MNPTIQLVVILTGGYVFVDVPREEEANVARTLLEACAPDSAPRFMVFGCTTTFRTDAVVGWYFREIIDTEKERTEMLRRMVTVTEKAVEDGTKGDDWKNG